MCDAGKIKEVKSDFDTFKKDIQAKIDTLKTAFSRLQSLIHLTLQA
jgi:hypothetical protein